jgi:hypothetical protein
MYGHKFTAQFGEYPDNTWVRCMMGLTPEQVADGLRMSMDAYTEWPPGAAQFRIMCLGFDPRNIDEEGNDSQWQHKRIESANREWRQERLLIDEAKRDAARKAGAQVLTDLKAMFGGAGCGDYE